MIRRQFFFFENPNCVSNQSVTKGKSFIMTEIIYLMLLRDIEGKVV